MTATAGCLSKLMVAVLCMIASVPPRVLAQPADNEPSRPRGFLGLQVQDAESGAESQGVMVVDMLAGSPAASAGLRIGDRIAAANGHPIATRLELARLVASLAPGATLRLSVRRDHRVRDMAVTLGEPPASLPRPNGSRTTPTAPATPAPDPSRSAERYPRGNGDVCSAICRREDECNLYSYNNCMKACSPNDRDASKYPARSKMSCQQLAVETGFAKEYTGSGSGQWSCRAVGTYVRANNGAPDYSSPENIDVTKWARTRDLAGFAALDACHGLMVLNTNQTVTPGTLTTEACKVIRCSK